MFNGLLPSAIFPRDILLYWDGGPSDRRSKTPFTSTSTGVTILKHRAKAVTFDGADSKIDCGSQIAGVGNITLLCWINAVNSGEGSAARICDNGKFVVLIGANSSLKVESDGSTDAVSGNNVFTTGAESFIAVTRTTAGTVNIYGNGVLSGTADQASGTPANGSGNLIIGNKSDQTRTFNGTICHLRIFSQILTTTQIGQIYNIEK